MLATQLRRRIGRLLRPNRSVPTRARLFVKERCGLCEDAVALLRPFQQHGQLALELVDIASEPELLRRYGLSIPVLEIDGAVLEWPFERSAVRRALG